MEKDSFKEISIVIPMYNEEEIVEELCQRLNNVLEKTGRSYEIVFVNDGSIDNTLNKLKIEQSKYKNFRILELRGNFGQTPALNAGFDNAKGNIIIAMDGDLQHLPEDIPKFINKIDEGFDIVSGWREDRKDSYFTRRLPSKIANFIMAYISGIKLRDFGTTFKAYRKEIIKEIRLYGQFHRFIPVLAAELKAKIVEIPIVNIRQKHRKSHYNITRTFTVFFDLIRLNFLNKYLNRPLQLFGSLGFAIAFIGFILESHLIYMKYVYNYGLMSYRAPLFILGIFFIIIGFLFFILGLISEMIFKLFYDLSPKKIYSIKKEHCN